MGIYSNKSMMSSGYSDIDIWSPCEQEIRCEGVDINFHEAALMAVAESERVYNNAMKEIGIAELHYLEENGQEMIYEAVDVHGALEKIKKFFVKLIDKVKALFHAFVTKMSSIFSDNKDFATKYKKEFFRKWNDVKSDFEFKGYNFTVNMNTTKTTLAKTTVGADAVVKKCLEYKPSEAGNLLDGVVSLDKVSEILYSDAVKAEPKKDNSGKTIYTAVEKWIDAIKDHDDDIEEFMRAQVATVYEAYSNMSTKPTFTKLDSEEFSKELFEVFRNGESTKDNIEKKEFSSATIISDIENSDKVIRAAERATKDLTKAIQDDIKELDRLEKEFGKTKPDTNHAHKNDFTDYVSLLLSLVVTVNGFVSKSKEYCVSANGVYLQALKDKCSQDKAIVAKVIAGGKKMQRESYDYSEDNNYTGSYLDTVVIR